MNADIGLRNAESRGRDSRVRNWRIIALVLGLIAAYCFMGWHDSKVKLEEAHALKHLKRAADVGRAVI